MAASVLLSPSGGVLAFSKGAPGTTADVHSEAPVKDAVDEDAAHGGAIGDDTDTGNGTGDKEAVGEGAGGEVGDDVNAGKIAGDDAETGGDAGESEIGGTEQEEENGEREADADSPVCTCEVPCTEDSIEPDCPVCSADSRECGAALETAARTATGDIFTTADGLKYKVTSAATVERAKLNIHDLAATKPSNDWLKFSGDSTNLGVVRMALT